MMLWQEAALFVAAMETYVDKRIALADARQRQRLSAGPGLREAVEDAKRQADIARLDFMSVIYQAGNEKR